MNNAAKYIAIIIIIGALTFLGYTAYQIYNGIYTTPATITPTVIPTDAEIIEPTMADLLTVSLGVTPTITTTGTVTPTFITTANPQETVSPTSDIKPTKSAIDSSSLVSLSAAESYKLMAKNDYSVSLGGTDQIIVTVPAENKSFDIYDSILKEYISNLESAAMSFTKVGNKLFFGNETSVYYMDPARSLVKQLYSSEGYEVMLGSIGKLDSSAKIIFPLKNTSKQTDIRFLIINTANNTFTYRSIYYSWPSGQSSFSYIAEGEKIMFSTEKGKTVTVDTATNNVTSE